MPLYTKTLVIYVIKNLKALGSKYKLLKSPISLKNRALIFLISVI